MLKKYELVETEKQRLLKTNVAPSDAFNKFLTEHETAPLSTGCKLADLIRRPQLNYALLKPFDEERPEYTLEIGEQVEIQLKYEGYIEKQMAQIARMRKLEEKSLPETVDYTQIRVLRLEAAEKLNAHRPANIGQASRISGVSPADISVLLVWETALQKGEQPS